MNIREEWIQIDMEVEEDEEDEEVKVIPRSYRYHYLSLEPPQFDETPVFNDFDAMLAML